MMENSKADRLSKPIAFRVLCCIDVFMADMGELSLSGQCYQNQANDNMHDASELVTVVKAAVGLSNIFRHKKAFM